MSAGPSLSLCARIAAGSAWAENRLGRRFTGWLLLAMLAWVYSVAYWSHP